jgi:transposase
MVIRCIAVFVGSSMGKVGWCEQMVQRIELSLNELRPLRSRIDGHKLAPDDWPIFAGLVDKLIERAESLQERMAAKVAAQQSSDADNATTGESSGDGVSQTDAAATSNTEDSASSAPASIEPASQDSASQGEPDEKKGRKGHGRNGVAAFTNATHINHELVPDIVGAVCEECGPVRGGGRMSPYREKIIIRIVGQSLFGAEVHHYEQVRCRICGKVITAAGPVEVLEGIGSSYITYSWSACATLLVMHYFAGAPFKRLEMLHDGWGVPMPDANQWKMASECTDLLIPLLRALEQYAIHNAVSLRIDDTGSEVIELRKQIRAEIAALQSVGKSTNDVRTAINATGVYLETADGNVITLFYTGRHHAGEIIDQLLVHRKSTEPKLAKVTDGASKNFDHQHADKLVEASCNAHAFLKFRAIKDKYPDEYATAAEVYKQVFDNDDEAEAQGLTPVERMLFHREHSKPLMKRLKAMCDEKITNRLVEPNSLLWEPVTFIINQWPRLTLFYQEPNVVLDTNVLEQTLIIPVRYLAGSFNYQTTNGSDVGDLSMTFVVTARANGVEPVAYLTYCLRHHKDLARRPEHYLPWVYRERLNE